MSGRRARNEAPLKKNTGRDEKFPEEGDKAPTAAPSSSSGVAAPGSLEAARERLVASITCSPVHVAMLRGPEHIYEFVNDSFRAAARFAFDPIGKPFGLAMAAPAGERVRAALDRVYATGETLTTNELYVPRTLDDGTLEDAYFNVVMQPTRDGSGAIDGVTIHAMPVTEQVQARKLLEAMNEQALRQREALRVNEAELREAQERLRTVLNSAPLLLLAIDREGRITLSEGREVETLGMTPGQNVGKSVFDLYGDNPAVVKVTRAALGGASPRGILPFRGNFYDAQLQPLRGHSGEIVGAIGVATNVTERVLAEESREKIQAQMLQTQKLESLGVLAGGIAHDFNNLLAGILGNASIALLDLENREGTRRALEDIVGAGRRAAALVRQLLTYCGKAPRQLHALDFGAQVRELLGLVEASIPKKVRIEIAIPEGLPTIEADAAQLQQVVMNLVINGAEAIGDRAGTVAIRAGVEELDEAAATRLVTSHGMRPGKYVFLEVRDDGSGMSEATRAKMFDPFFTTKSAGRGLGLAAVVGIMHAHGGAIHLETAVGRGTTFRVYFPVSGKPIAKASLARADAFRGTGTVLVVDDEAPVRMVARRTLEWFGFDVVEAPGGRAGVAIFRERHESIARGDERNLGVPRSTPIALVLLDMTMPEMGGEDVFRELRAIKADARVVLMSGYAEAHARERFHLEGIAGFLEKPFTAEQLAEVLDKALAR